MFHVGMVREGYSFPVTFGGYNDPGDYQLWRSNGDGAGGGPTVAFAASDVLGIKLVQADIQANARLIWYKNGVQVESSASGFTPEGSLIVPIMWSLYQDIGIDGRIKTDPDLMTHFDAYSSANGWPI